MKKIFALMMVVTILGAFLAGCKGSEGDSGSTTGTTSTSTGGSGTTK